MASPNERVESETLFQNATSIEMGQASEPTVTSHFLTRIFIAVLGTAIGVLTFVPNVMMASASATAAQVGTMASFCFIVGGLYGGYKGTLIWLVPGIILQIAMFIII